MADTQSKVLAYSVTLWDAGSNSYKTFYPGDSLPLWAESLVRNPKAFVTDEGVDHPRSLVPGRDVPIAGPSQLPYDTDVRFADQPRYGAASSAPNLGYNVVQEGTDVVFSGAPTLHDQVAAHAVSPEHANDARKASNAVRTGKLEPEAARLAREARERDLSDAARGDAIFRDQQAAAQAAVTEQQRNEQAQAMALQLQVSETVHATTAENFAAAQARASALQEAAVVQNTPIAAKVEAPQGTTPEVKKAPAKEK